MSRINLFCGAVKIHYEIRNEAITLGLMWVFGQCETISQKAYKCVARESADQPAHSRRLIRDFPVRIKKTRLIADTA